MIFLDFFDFFLYELVSDNIITPHFGDQEHNLFHLVTDILLLILEIGVNLTDHLFLEQFSPTLVLLDLLDLDVFDK